MGATPSLVDGHLNDLDSSSNVLVDVDLVFRDSNHNAKYVFSDHHAQTRVDFYLGRVMSRRFHWNNSNNLNAIQLTSPIIRALNRVRSYAFKNTRSKIIDA